ncbi:MAG: hypothetical protein N2258_04405 [Brevinematales bacterium]|nr:hypothetical protein [Brevinematales bacterium]
MKKIFLIILITIFSCSKEAKNIVKSEDKPIESSRAISMGPIFLPENSFFSTISINYFTSIPTSTKVFFTMAGEIDWVREEKSSKIFHKMIFKDLEESTFYKFAYKEETSKKEGFIKTLPYGTEYEFEFLITTTDFEIGDLRESSFIVILSKTNQMGINEFYEIYKKNENIFSSNIIVPIFDIVFNGEKIFKSKDDGIDYFYYKDVAIIGINKKLENYDKISYYIPENGKVYLLISDIGRREVEIIAEKYKFYVEKIYVYKNSYIKSDKVFSLDNPIKVSVTKNSKYAMVLKEVF